MKKLLLSFLFIGSLSANAQTTLFEDNFDSYTNFAKAGVGSWTLTDVDLRPTYGFGGGTTFLNSGTPMAYIVFNSTAVTITGGTGLTPTATSNWTARSGQKAMACFAAVPGAGITANDDWLISPQITLASTGNELSFWAKSCDGDYPDEQFEVFVSTTTTAVASFTSIGAAEFTDFGDYVEYTYDLSAFDGQSIYVGIHCTSEDQFGFMIDDFKVTTTELGVNESLAKKFSTYPNPASNVVNISNNNNILLSNVDITDINGRTVKSLQVNNLTEIQMNVSDLNSGVYFMNIDTDSGRVVKKFIKS
jgi:hypothetical protein